MLADAILYDISSNGVVKVLIETHSSFAESLARFLSMYRLRSVVTIKSRFLLSQLETDIHSPMDELNNDIILKTLDPRSPTFGIRIVRETPKGQSPTI